MKTLLIGLAVIAIVRGDVSHLPSANEINSLDSRQHSLPLESLMYLPPVKQQQNPLFNTVVSGAEAKPFQSSSSSGSAETHVSLPQTSSPSLIRPSQPQAFGAQATASSSSSSEFTQSSSSSSSSSSSAQANTIQNLAQTINALMANVNLQQETTGSQSLENKPNPYLPPPVPVIQTNNLPSESEQHNTIATSNTQFQSIVEGTKYLPAQESLEGKLELHSKQVLTQTVEEAKPQIPLIELPQPIQPELIEEPLPIQPEATIQPITSAQVSVMTAQQPEQSYLPQSVQSKPVEKPEIPLVQLPLEPLPEKPLAPSAPQPFAKQPEAPLLPVEQPQPAYVPQTVQTKPVESSQIVILPQPSEPIQKQTPAQLPQIQPSASAEQPQQAYLPQTEQSKPIEKSEIPLVQLPLEPLPERPSAPPALQPIENQPEAPLLPAAQPQQAYLPQSVQSKPVEEPKIPLVQIPLQPLPEKPSVPQVVPVQQPQLPAVLAKQPLPAEQPQQAYLPQPAQSVNQQVLPVEEKPLALPAPQQPQQPQAPVTCHHPEPSAQPEFKETQSIPTALAQGKPSHTFSAASGYNYKVPNVKFEINKDYDY